MTTERDNNDPRLSRAYRDLAEEKTPAELDHKVLAMAAAEARTRYGLTRFWIRPVAWAATIGLSLAIILEVSQYGTTPATGTDPSVRRVVEEQVKDEDEGRPVRDLQKRSDAPQPLQVSPPPAAEKAAREPASPTANGAPLATPESRAVAQDPEVAEAALVPETDDMGLLRETEEQARMRAVEVLPTAASGIAPRKEQYASCDEEARSSAATWYDCIEKLRTQGLAEAAAVELEALREAFPEFREPARQ